MADMTAVEKKAFQKKLNGIITRLMRVTGISNKSQLGYWLFKNKERTSEMYFPQAKYHCYLNYSLIIDRCLEEGFDLNEIFGAERTEEYKELLGKYKKLEDQVKLLIQQNSTLLGENKKIGEEFRKISASSHDLMVNYMALVNKKK
jgi:hypothetical protein